MSAPSVGPIQDARKVLAEFMAHWHHISLELAALYVADMTDAQVRERSDCYAEMMGRELTGEVCGVELRIDGPIPTFYRCSLERGHARHRSPSGFEWEGTT